MCIHLRDYYIDISRKFSGINFCVFNMNRGEGIEKKLGFYGTPTICIIKTGDNHKISVMPDAKIDVIAGVNLPMLIKLVEVRDQVKFDEAIRVGRDAGQKYIRVASEVMDRTA